MRALLLLPLVALLVLTTPVAAWWAKGHMTVSQIALRNLRDPANAPKLQAIVDVLNKLGPYKEYETCVDVAMWADNIRAMGLTTMSSWHFVNYIYNPSNYTVFSQENGDYVFANTSLAEVFNAKRNPVSVVNVGNLIPQLMSAVKNQVRYRHANGSTSAYSEIIVASLANIIHFVGDSHQPCHSTSIFSEEMPRGDLGGNLINVYYWNTTGNLPSDDPSQRVSMRLHFFWDSIAEGPQMDMVRPLNPNDARTISDFAMYLENQYQFPESLRTELNSTVYVTESHEAAKQYVYNFGNGQSNTNTSAYPQGIYLDAEYIRNARTCAQQRVALAGYRLAAIMDNILPSVSMDDIEYGLNTVKTLLTQERHIRADGPSNESRVSSGSVAGIVIACFVLGALLGTFIATLACVCRRRNATVSRKKLDFSA